MVTIVIQAGGKSTRMGQDKALMLFLGRPLIARLIERLASVGAELLVTTNQPENYAFLNVPLVVDVLPGMGALGGLYSALLTASQPFVAVVACDMPFVSPELLIAQRDLLLREEADVVIPHSGETLEPLHALYRRETCLPAVYTALERGERKMTAWFLAVKVRVMPPDEVRGYDPDLISFVNLNSPAEFQAAEALARQIEGKP